MSTYPSIILLIIIQSKHSNHKQNK